MSKFINKFFPIPDFLKIPSFGIDISDESLKFIQLKKVDEEIKVLHYGSQKIPTGIIEGGEIKDLKKMEEIILNLKKEKKIKAVRVSLPEEQVYLFTICLAKEGLDQIKEAVEFSLEDHIPLSGEEVVFDYEIISENSKNLEIQVAAIPNKIVEDYLSIFKKANILVKSFELEAQAIARSIIPKKENETSMIIDFGEKRSGIFIVHNGIVNFTSTLEVGGLFLTKIIENNFKVSFEEAEQIKKQYGLERNSIHQEVFSLLLNSVSVLKDEITKHFIYWHTTKDKNGKTRPPIRKVILCGGDSNLKGLTDYLTVGLKTKVELANVWINIIDTTKKVPPIIFTDSLTFAGALGLALSDFNYD